MTKVLKAELSGDSLQELYDELLAYRAKLENRVQALARRLSQEGAEIARVKVTELNASYTGGLSSSIQGYYSPESGVALIYTDCWYAAFVEFGTGIVGQGSPHPAAAEHGWVYDVNAHGEAGWWYPKDGRVYWTRGMESRPFLYETAQELRSRCRTIAREVFGR